MSSGDVSDGRGAGTARVFAAVLAAALLAALAPVASQAGVTVLCTPVDCESSEDCGTGDCVNGNCACDTQADCPAGSVCLGAPENICVVCPPTRTATATHTATVTATASATATVTATATPLPTGAACMTGSQCASGFCVDQVCCGTACDLPGQQCNAAQNPGNCTTVAAPAPALTETGLLFAALAMLAVGAVTLWTRRADRSKSGRP